MISFEFLRVNLKCFEWSKSNVFFNSRIALNEVMNEKFKCKSLENLVLNTHRVNFSVIDHRDQVNAPELNRLSCCRAFDSCKHAAIK